MCDMSRGLEPGGCSCWDYVSLFVLFVNLGFLFCNEFYELNELELDAEMICEQGHGDCCAALVLDSGYFG